MKTRPQIGIALIILLILATNTYSQEQTELQAKGVTVYAVYQLPINGYNTYDFFNLSYAKSDLTNPPYYYLKKLNEAMISKLSTSFSNNGCNKSGYKDLIFYKCDYRGIEVYYDGYWLFGGKNIVESDVVKNLSEVSLDNQVGDIYDILDDWKAENNISSASNGVISIVHIDSLTTNNFSYPNPDSSTYAFDNLEFYQSYKNNICNFLDKPINCNRTKLIAFEFPFLKDEYREIFIRIKKDNTSLYYRQPRQSIAYDPQIFIYRDDAPATIYTLFLDPIGYLTMGFELIDLSKDLSIEAEALEENLSDIRPVLRNKTRDIQNTLESLEPENGISFKETLDEKELKLKEIESKINSIESYYLARKSQLENVPGYYSSDYFLFHEENVEQMNYFSTVISQIKTNQEISKRELDGLWEIYYNEIDAARTKQNNTNTNYALILAVLAILTPLILTRKGPIKDLGIFKKYSTNELIVLLIIIIIDICIFLVVGGTNLLKISVMLVADLIIVILLFLRSGQKDEPEEIYINAVITLIFLSIILLSSSILLYDLELPYDKLFLLTFILFVTTCLLGLTRGEEKSIDKLSSKLHLIQETQTETNTLLKEILKVNKLKKVFEFNLFNFSKKN